MNDHYHVPDAASVPFNITQTQDEEPSPKEKKQKRGFKIRHLSPEHARTNDEIHTTIDFCPVVIAVIDTPQFQRLRGLNQLGTSEHTYMNSNHRRFEHSIGVAHLAERMVKHLDQRQPNLHITEKDKLCVKLAGLCHDLGHGPFSHVYDGTFPNRLNAYLSRNPELMECYDGIPKKPSKWSHEDGSCMMIDALLKELGLEIDTSKLDEPLKQIADGVSNTSFRVYDAYDIENEDNDEDTRKKPNTDLILTSRDWIFIKEMILGKPVEQTMPRGLWRDHESGYVGRPNRHQEFFYDIVANRHSGLDVDKIDYFARDARRVFRGSGEIFFPLIEEAVVAWGKCSRPEKCFYCNEADPTDHLMICYPEKCAEMCVGFFHHRFKLHSSVYTHKTTQASTFMIADVMTFADPYFRLSPYGASDNERGLPLSRAMRDPDVYVRMRDSVIDLIEFSQDARLEKAQEVIRRLRCRDLYKCAAVRKLDMKNDTDVAIWKQNENQVEQDILAIRGEHDGGRVTLNPEDIIVEKRNIHSGAKEDNPLSRMRFLPKCKLLLLTKHIDALPLAAAMPEKNFVAHTPIANQENSIRIFCRTSKAKCDLLSHAFSKWEEECEEQYSGNIQTFCEGIVDDAPVKFNADGEEELLTQEEGTQNGNFVSPHPNSNQNVDSQNENRSPAKARRKLKHGENWE